jgi:hypothetical protein
LQHHFRLKRPEELRMMVREVLLHRFKQQLIRLTHELRPALAVCDSALPLFDRLHVAQSIWWLAFLGCAPPLTGGVPPVTLQRIGNGRC